MSRTNGIQIYSMCIVGRSAGFRMILSGVVVVLALIGCAAVGPDYKPPQTGLLLEVGMEPKDGEDAYLIDPSRLAEWWTSFNDSLLTDLIKQAVSENLDLKQARTRLRETRARRGLSQADQFPALDMSGGASRTRGSENSGGGDIRELYTAGFDAGWEIDIFGGVRRAVEAADADLQASEADLNDVLVSLTAEVALNYVEVRTLQARLESAELNLDVQQETYDLVRFRFQAGLSDELSLQQASYNLESTRSQIPDLRSSLEAAKNRLAVLTGRSPGKIHGLLAEQQPIPVVPTTVATGIPAEILRQRPDIRKAERELAAQTARIGVATADLYPRFSLNGSIGLESLNSGDLLTAGSRYWNIGPGISWKVFDAGAVRRNIEIQSAIQEQYLVAYENTVLEALEEVNNALVSYAEDQKKRDSLKSAVIAARRAEGLARDLYLTGLADFSEVLEAQRTLLSFQNQLVESEGSVASDLVRLYKAYGGGWKSKV